MFCGYLTDRRYGWDELCEQRFGTHPVQVCHEWNMAVHRSEFEARPGNRPLSREELQGFFDYCDDRVGAVHTGGWKGWLAAFRDTTLFKVTYARVCEHNRNRDAAGYLGDRAAGQVPMAARRSSRTSPITPSQ